MINFRHAYGTRGLPRTGRPTGALPSFPVDGHPEGPAIPARRVLELAAHPLTSGSGRPGRPSGSAVERLPGGPWATWIDAFARRRFPFGRWR